MTDQPIPASWLIPGEFYDELVQMRGAGDAPFWRIGDISAALVDEANGAEKRDAIRIAVADVVGVLPSTVRDYEACARYYPEGVRNAYPTLTRWHFRIAKRAGNIAMAMSYLNWAIESPDDYGGNPMPVRVLAAKMNGHKSDTDWPGRVRSFLDRAYRAAPEATERAVYEWQKAKR